MNGENAPPPSAAASTPDGIARRFHAELGEALGDDFEIVRELGSGSMAKVYLAREKALGRLVAVKVLLPRRASDEIARRRFEREARAAASLVHPHVVQVFRFGRLPDETPFLVMRYVKGRTMEERLAAGGLLPVDLARRVLHEVASALAAAHARGIVHRDVRPANILWDEESESAHLTDFGIAALLATGGDEVTRLTKTGQMVGDPRYLSPEQLLDEDLTELADMYTFGVLGYQLFSGEGPYEARTNSQWITAHLSAEPRDLRAMRPEAAPATADLLRRCLSREPKHRPSAADAARVLGAVGAAAGVGARSGAGGGAGMGAGVGGGGGGGVGDDPVDLRQLIKRRVPQIVAIAGGAGLGLMGLMSQFVEMEIAPPIVYRLTLPFVAAGVAAATVIAWFHGERGRQETQVVEWILLGVIALVWIGVSVWVLVGG